MDENDKKIRDSRGRFLPGCSGNPDGRPKGTRTYLLNATDNLESVLARLVKLANSKKEHIALKAIETILDRAEGKATVTTVLEGNIRTSTELNPEVKEILDRLNVEPPRNQ